MVKVQPMQKIHKTQSQPIDGYSGTCLSFNLCREAQIGGTLSMLAQAQDPISKRNNTKKAGDMAQLVECLLSKCKALHSTPTTTNK
jgi:hypothetical protein